MIPGAPGVYVLLALLLVVIGGAASWLLTRWQHWRHQQRRRERDRSLAWAQPTQVEHLLTDGRDPHRVVLGTLAGRDVAAEPRRSVLVVAPTQAGKTTCLVIPTAARWRGPLVVASTKVDVLRQTHRHREAVGGGTAVFDPTGVVDQTGDIPTARWSPLLSAASYVDAERTARRLLKAAAGDSPDINGGKFWENTAGKLLAPLLFAAANTAGDLGTIGYWLDTKETAEIDQILRHLRDPDALNAWTASTGRESRTRDSAYASCESLLTAFTAPGVRAATTLTDGAAHIDPARVLDERQTVYLIGSADDQDELAPLFIALVQSIVREAQRRYTITGLPLDPPLMLLLDEAGHVAPLPELPMLAATGAGQGIQIVSVWQDLAQVEDRYGRRARTLVNNHTARVFLPGSADHGTLDQVSRTLGDHQVDRDSLSVDETGRRSRTRSRHDVRLAPPDYVRTLPKGTAIVLYGRDPALKIHTQAWFDEPALRRALGPPITAPLVPAPPPRHPQAAATALPQSPVGASTGSTGPLTTEAPMTDQQPNTNGTSLQSIPGPAHSTLTGLVADVDRPGYAVDAAGRRYFLTHAADGSTVPIPVELTEEQRAELDAARNRAHAYTAQLTLDMDLAEVVPLYPDATDAGDP
jgi:type IV secretory pathway TraG/TraD family ATPase VirD4